MLATFLASVTTGDRRCGRSLNIANSTLLGSIMINLTSSGVALYRMVVMIVFTHTVLPEPVAPAIRRCGIEARSAITGVPAMSLPSASFNLDLGSLYSFESRTSFR